MHKLSLRALPSAVIVMACLAPVAALAASAGAAPHDQIRMSAAAVERAGIATVPAAATLADAAAPGAGAITLTGTVVAPQTALVIGAANWDGVVQQVHAGTLQRVKAGTPLVTLFSQPWMEVQREYAQLAAQARLASDKLARDEALYRDGIIARARLDESRTAARMATLAADQHVQELRAGGLSRAAIDALAAEHRLSPLLTVRARAAGTLLELPASVGQHAPAGTALAKIVRDGPLWVELQAARQQLPLLPVGTMLEVAEGCRVKVVAVSPVVNGANQTAQVRAEQLGRNACLKVNAFVEARLLQPAPQAGSVAVPAAAVVRRGRASYVFVKNAAGFAAVPVQPGATTGDRVWVRGALPAGTPVAARGIVALKGAWSGLGDAEGGE